MNTEKNPPITLEDVKRAIEALGLSPEEASARTIREHLGRGSNSTIQRFLDTLRGKLPDRQAMEQRVLEKLKQVVPLLVDAGEAAVERSYARLMDHYEESLSQAEARIEELEKEAQALGAFEAKAQELQALVAAQEEALRREGERAKALEMALRECRAAKEALEARLDLLVEQLSTLKAALRANPGEAGKGE